MLTGGLGFIGHHTVEHFLETTDHHIVVIDALRHAGRIDRLTDIEGYDPDRVTVIWHDLRVPFPKHVIGEIGSVNWIINMASDSHVDRSITDPVPFVNNNVQLALTVFEYARLEQTPVVQVSTDEVYGPAEPGQFHTEEDPLKPSNPYSASKAAQEQIAYSYWRTYGVPLLITRTMNNFGERQHPEKFVPMAIGRILHNYLVPLHGDGTHWSSRVWLHARNHADALRHLTSFSPPKEPYVCNVAGNEEINVLDMTMRIADILGLPFEFEMVDFHSSRPGHDMRYALDGSRLAESGWKAPVPLDESLERTVRWFEKNPHWL